MADSWAIDKAVYTRLASDTALLALMPYGVYMAEGARPFAKAFVILKKEETNDVGVFNGTGYLDRLYLVEARAVVEEGGPAGDVDAAALRIYTLLHDQPLTVAGFTYMAMYRETEATAERTTRDSVDESLQFNRNGAYYRVQMSL